MEYYKGYFTGYNDCNFSQYNPNFLIQPNTILPIILLPNSPHINPCLLQSCPNYSFSIIVIPN